MIRRGYPISVTCEQVIAHMPGTVNELAAAAKVGRTAIKNRLKELREAGKLYVHSYVAAQNGFGPHVAVYAYGDEPDAPAPGEPGFVEPRRRNQVRCEDAGRGAYSTASHRETDNFIKDVLNRRPQGPFAALFNYDEVNV